MRETKFIAQNQPKWEELERVLESPYKNPDHLNELFIQVTDDLSYSRTFYPNRSVRVYLNGLAQRIFLSIYRNRKSQRHRLITFWTDELPHLVYESRQAFRLSFFVFALAMGIGMLSCAMDPDFAAVILGDDYVQMTEENIRSGDPMRVYKQRGEFGMTLGITVNNIYVSFLTFVLGAFFSIGSIALLLYNGVMVGAFQYFFIERGLFWESFLTIWMHGALEISAIVIAGAAGITMGQGLLFPGTYTRMQAFQRSARRGIKIMVGIAPLFMVAGFIEGYLTRHTDLPDVARGFFIVVCLLVVLVYFVWYPWMKSRIGFYAPIRDARIPPDDMLHLNFTQIKASGEILADAILLLKKRFGKLLPPMLAAALLYTLVVFIFAGKPPDEVFTFPSDIFFPVTLMGQFFSASNSALAPVMAWFVLTLTAVGVFEGLLKEEKITTPDKKNWWRSIFICALGAALLEGILYTQNGYTVLLVWGFFPVIMLWTYIAYREKGGIIASIPRLFRLLSGQYFRTLGLISLMLVLGLLMLTLLNTGLGWFFFSLLSWILNFEQSTMDQIGVVALTYIYIFLMMWMAALLFAGMALQYYTLLEITEARTLKARIENLGTNKRLRGMERESILSKGI
jgi:uncharacterized membrane protein SpoIIM required for sporulation